MKLTINGIDEEISESISGVDKFATDKTTVALRVNGELKDLATDLATLPEGAVVETVDISSPDGLNILRHSATHVLAQAVQNKYPDVNLGIGPFITDGFYYDFGNIESVTPEILKGLEKDMMRIVKEGQRFVRRPISDDDARAELANQPYKLELIDLKGGSDAENNQAADGASVEVGGGELTMYDNVRRNGDVDRKSVV